MRGINPQIKGAIVQIVDDMFDRIAIHLLGNLPQFKNKKLLAFTARPEMTLAHLFVKSLGKQYLLPSQEDMLKNMLSTTYDHIESLKSKTKANLITSIDSNMAEARMKRQTPSASGLKTLIVGHLDSAKKHLSLITESETNKVRSMGRAAQIAGAAASLGISDPTVFWVVVRDASLCQVCISLHMMPDKVTPRVWKLSEIGFNYHKKGETNPKIMGPHPHCRCQMVHLTPGFGFKKGFVAYVGLDHDEYKKQREE